MPPNQYSSERAFYIHFDAANVSVWTPTIASEAVATVTPTGAYEAAEASIHRLLLIMVGNRALWMVKGLLVGLSAYNDASWWTMARIGAQSAYTLATKQI